MLRLIRFLGAQFSQTVVSVNYAQCLAECFVACCKGDRRVLQFAKTRPVMISEFNKGEERHAWKVFLKKIGIRFETWDVDDFSDNPMTTTRPDIVAVSCVDGGDCSNFRAPQAYKVCKTMFYEENQYTTNPQSSDPMLELAFYTKRSDFGQSESNFSECLAQCMLQCCGHDARALNFALSRPKVGAAQEEEEIEAWRSFFATIGLSLEVWADDSAMTAHPDIVVFQMDGSSGAASSFTRRVSERYALCREMYFDDGVFRTTPVSDDPLLEFLFFVKKE